MPIVILITLMIGLLIVIGLTIRSLRNEPIFYSDSDEKPLLIVISVLLFLVFIAWLCKASCSPKPLLKTETLSILTLNNCQYVEIPNDGFSNPQSTVLINVNNKFGRTFKENDKFLYKEYSSLVCGILFMFDTKFTLEPIASGSDTTGVVIK